MNKLINMIIILALTVSLAGLAACGCGDDETPASPQISPALTPTMEEAPPLETPQAKPTHTPEPGPTATAPATFTPMPEPDDEQASSIDTGLIAYYPFDGDIKDYSGNEAHATNHGAEFASGKYDQALNFDGSGDYVYAPVNINATAVPQVTITLWANATVGSSGQTLLSHDDGSYDRSLTIDNRGGGTGWSAFVGDGGVLGYHPVQPGQWTFVAAVYDQDSGTARLYVNDTTYEGEGICNKGWEHIHIGENPGFASFFKGKIDEIKIFNYALSEDELESLQETGSTGSVGTSGETAASNGGTSGAIELGQDIVIKPLYPLEKEYEFSATETSSLNYDFEGASPISKAYRFEPEGVEFNAPVQVTMPLNDTEIEGEVTVISRKDNGDTSFIQPSEVDESADTVTFLANHFSDFEGYDIPPASYSHANVVGSLYLNGDYEEEPDQMYFDFTCPNTVSGRPANFVVPVDGIAQYAVLPPIPDYLFGQYRYHGLIGFSENFIFAGEHPYPEVNVSIVGGIYQRDLPVVATSSRMEGTVKDREGEPVDGAIITVYAGESLDYSTTSKSDGSYKLELIGLDFELPTANMESTFPYYVNYGQEPCDYTDDGDVTLKAGHTLNKDFTIAVRGMVEGEVTDSNQNLVQGATIEITDSLEDVYQLESNAGGYYGSNRIAEGEATIKATCPDGQPEETKTADVKCGKTAEVDFTLDCADTFKMTYERTVLSEDMTGLIESTSEAVIMFKPGENGEVTLVAPGTATHTYTPKLMDGCEWVYQPSEFTLEAEVQWQFSVSKEGDQYEFLVWEPLVVDEETQPYNLKTVCGTEAIDHGPQSMRANQGGVFSIHGQTEMSGQLPVQWEYHDESSVPGGMMSAKDDIWVTIERVVPEKE